MCKSPETPESPPETSEDPREDTATPNPPPSEEHGGPAGPEPTRFGDWERKGRCSDF